MKLIQSYVSYR